MRFAGLFKKYIPDLDVTKRQQLVRCIFHPDNRPSLSINIEEGLFHCFGCGKKGGIKDFCDLVGEDFNQWLPLLDTFEQEERETRNIIRLHPSEIENIVSSSHQRLLNKRSEMTFLINEKLWKEQVIRKYRIGLEGDKFLIPIPDKDGNITGVIQYRRTGDIRYKWIRYSDWEGVFPENINKQNINYIVVCEGISDTLCLLSNNIAAITPIIPTGAAKYLQRFDFTGIENVVICTDNDDTGEIIRRKYREFFERFYPNIRLFDVRLPEGYKDITEFIKRNNSEEFIELIRRELLRPDEVYELVPFENLFSARYVNKKVKFYGFVAAKHMQAYVLPKKVKVNCLAGQFDYCIRCPVFAMKTAGLSEINISEEEQLKFIDKEQESILKRLRKKMGVPSACYSYEIENVETNICEIADVISLYEFGTKDIGYRPIPCISLGEEILYSTSLSYEISGTVKINPANSQLIVIVKSVKNIERSFDYDKNQDSLISELMLGKQDYDVDYLYNRLLFLGNDLSKVTGIKERDMFHIVSYLSFASSYQFTIYGKEEKSAIDLLIIGDTRTGKTTVLSKYVELFGGRIVSGESVSAAGLIGGMQQMAYGKWTISWGIIPQNDKSIVVIDEADAINKELMGRLTSIRTTGYAEIVKIQQALANARTRLVFIANPKYNVAKYSHPIRIINEFGWAKQDIARMDLVFVLSQDDVQNPEFEISETTIPIWAYKHIVNRAFSLSASDIIVSEDIVKLAQSIAERMSRKYLCDVPLFTEGYTYIKLLKVASAIANVFIIPLDETVLYCAEKLIYDIFDNYVKLDKYVLANRREEELISVPEIIREIENTLTGRENMMKFLRKLDDLDVISFRDIQEITGLSMNDAYRFMSFLIQNNCLRKNSRYYSKTKGFSLIIKELISSDEEIG
jgi:5S rRNA maturation endonuclease (ribonuclease M5)